MPLKLPHPPLFGSLVDLRKASRFCSWLKWRIAVHCRSRLSARNTV